MIPRLFLTMQQRDSDDASALNSLSKFTLFETKRWAYDSCSTLTASRFYITASTSDTHRVLKIDRTDPTTLNVTEDATTYDSAELDLLLRMVQDGNKSQGGLEKVLEFQCVVTVGPRLMISGIVGFVQFTAGWYLVLITKRSVVGLLGGHYSRLQTNARADRSLSLRRNHGMLCQTFHLTPASHHCQQGGAHRTGDQVSHQRTKLTDRMLNIFQQVDLTKNFYFSCVPNLSELTPSYSYDITNTLQTNLTVPAKDRLWNTRFMWNHHLLSPAFELEQPRGRSRWVLPLIHGFVDQASELCLTIPANTKKSTSSQEQSTSP